MPNRPCVAWSPDLKGLGPEGMEGPKLEETDACVRLGEPRASHRALRADGRLRPGPASGADGPCARERRTGLRPQRKELAPPRACGLPSVRPNQELGSRARRTWLVAGRGPCVHRRSHGPEPKGGRSLLRPNGCSDPLPPLWRHNFGRGSEPPKNQDPSGFRGSSAALPGPIGARLRVGAVRCRTGRPACRTRLERSRFGRGSRRHEGLVPEVGLTARQRAPRLETGSPRGSSIPRERRVPFGVSNRRVALIAASSFGSW
jgi:hypothetical protein